MVIGKERGTYLPIGFVLSISELRFTLESRTVSECLFISRSSIVGNNRSKLKTNFTEFNYIKRCI